MNWKKNLVLIFFLLAGVILGALLANVGQHVPFLSWLAYGKTVGISPDSPMVIDLSVVRVAFGFEMGINVAQIITIILSILGYKSISKKL